MSISATPLSTAPLGATIASSDPGGDPAPEWIGASYFMPLDIVGKKQAFETLLPGFSTGATLAIVNDMNAPATSLLLQPFSLIGTVVTGLHLDTLNMSFPLNSLLAVRHEMPAPLRASLAHTLAMTIPTMFMATLHAGLAPGFITGLLTAPLDMGAGSVIICNNSYSIVSRGTNLDNLTIDLEIKQDLDSAHSSFTISSITQELYNLLAPGDRLTITIDDLPREFVLEEIGMPGNMGFNIWGRSASCLLDTPHADQVTIETDSSQTAAGLALELTGLDCWQADDYPLPDGWSMTGTPVEILIRLAQAVGAVVQPTATGVEIVPRFKTRPIEWHSVTPVEFYTREQNILSLSWDDEAATHWNSVTVVGRSTPWLPPIIEVEEQSPVIGDAVHVDIYRKGTSEESFNSMVTAGLVALLEESITTVIANEVVTFSGYRSSLKYPVDELLSFTWIGDNRGSIYWLDGGRSTELELAPGGAADMEGFAIASVTYRTSYDRYRLSGHNVNELLLVMAQAENAAVKVRLKVNGLTLPAATDITDELVTTAAAAVARGTGWLDSSRYDKRKISMSAPHKLLAVPGAVVSVADEIEGVSGPAMIVTRSVKCSGGAVVDTMGVEQCLF